jgi:hypothetical protein
MDRMVVGRLCGVAAGIVVLTASGLARANDPAAAREQLKTGYTLSQEGKCDEALPHLLESLRLDPKAITLINLANCEEKVGKLSAALGHWADARARARDESAKPIEDEAARRATALEARVPKLTIRLAAGAPKDTTVTRDGVALGAVSLGMALPVNPGAHVVVASAKGHEAATFRIETAEGEAKELEVAPGVARREPEPSGPPDGASPRARGASPLVWIGFGVAGAGVAAGAITGLMAMNKASAVKSACPNLDCPDRSALDDVDSGRTLGTVSTIAFAVAGAGALLGVYGLVFARPKGGAASASITIGPRLGGGAIAGRF